ncbi:MAG TPA: OmpA family protein [Thermoanaerobaculia bacterium]|nr:OmpA family protein [Thermoanaerobaculia bacterium]
MRTTSRSRSLTASVAVVVAAALLAACTGGGGDAPRTRRNEPYMTKRDKTVKGGSIGAVVGAAGAVAAGKREADEILAGAVIGAGVGAGIGAYMDAQEEKLARIPGTTVERVDEETLLVHFDSDVLFDVDSATIDSSGRDALEQVAEVLSEYRKTAVVVQGHTDSTGSEEHNERLSERRATSVERYLEQRGVDGGRIIAEGYGEGYPVASNASESGRQLNRRVDILLKAKA